ncbi:MAG TPA: hypothetical protein VG796_06005 [Verrucomicrobiales bacterium]|nr:hypothetical protein [Verrucomicrobiales bacterium]
MKRPFFLSPFMAALFGVFAGLLIAAVPLWRQQMGSTGRGAVKEEPAPTAASFADAWKSARNSGSKTGTVLRAATLTESLTAEECRAAAASTLAAGAREPLRDVLRRWATLDGPGAFAWLEKHPELRPETTLDADAAWAAADPAAFSAWMVRHIASLTPEKAALDWSIAGAVKCLLQYDVRAAIRVAGAMGASGPRNSERVLERNLLRTAVRTNDDAAAAGAEILAHPEWLTVLRKERPLPLLVTLRECWQEFDPAGWDNWAEAHPAAAAKSDPAPPPPGIAFLRSPDRAAAAMQILKNARPENLQEISDGLLRLWTSQDMAAAGEWLNALPDGSVKSAAAQSYALHAATEDPNAALRWAGTLTDDAVRARTQRRVFTQWYDAAPSAAATWLKQSGWSESQMQAARDIMAVAGGMH